MYIKRTRARARDTITNARACTYGRTKRGEANTRGELIGRRLECVCVCV